MIAIPPPPAASAPSYDTPQAMIEAAQVKQNFYPIARGYDADLLINYYVLGGPLSVRGRHSGGRAAALMNIVRSPNGPFQIVEVGRLTCAPVAFRPSYRIAFDATGQLMPSTGPVVDPKSSATFVTPMGLTTMASVLCDGQEPPDRINDQDLAHFRRQATAARAPAPSANGVSGRPSLGPVYANEAIVGALKKQDFYPIGPLPTNGPSTSVYLMGGLSGHGGPVVRAAALVNVAKPSKGLPFQVVEIGDLDCASARLTMRLHIFVDYFGQPYDANNSPLSRATLSAPNIARMVSILCGGVRPANRIAGGTLAAFRPQVPAGLRRRDAFDIEWPTREH